MSKPETIDECLNTKCKDCDYVAENELEISTFFNIVTNCEILRKIAREEDQHGL